MELFTLKEIEISCQKIIFLTRACHKSTKNRYFVIFRFLHSHTVTNIFNKFNLFISLLFEKQCLEETFCFNHWHHFEFKFCCLEKLPNWICVILEGGIIAKHCVSHNKFLGPFLYKPWWCFFTAGCASEMNRKFWTCWGINQLIETNQSTSIQRLETVNSRCSN